MGYRFLVARNYRLAGGMLGAAAFAAVLFVSSGLRALPQGGSIVEGSGSITQSGARMDIHQRSDFLATQFKSFDIGPGELVQAHQSSAAQRLLIRVDGASGTNIAGTLSARGQVILENPLGIQFSSGSVVNVGGLIATASKGLVANHGTINAGAGGVALSGARVENSGRVIANGGDVYFGAGDNHKHRAKLVAVGGVVEAKRLSRKGGKIVLEGREGNAG